MKKEQQGICESIKLTQVKMAENEKVLNELHSQRNHLRQLIQRDEYNLNNDQHCLSLRRQPLHTYEGPIIKIPFITS